MFRKIIEFKDYNGKDRKEEHWFNLEQHEVYKLQMGVKGGLIEKLKEAVRTEDSPTIIEYYEKIVDASYGIRGADGKSFMKSPEILAAFKCTPAYSKLFMEILTNPEKCDEFTRGVIPADAAASLPKDLNDALPEDMKDLLANGN